MKKIILSVLICLMAVLFVSCGDAKPAEAPAGTEVEVAEKNAYDILYDKVKSEEDVWGMKLDDDVTFGFVISDDGDLSWCLNSEYDSGEVFVSLDYKPGTDTMDVFMTTDFSGIENFSSAVIYPDSYSEDKPYVYSLESDAIIDQETIKNLFETSLKVLMMAAEVKLDDIGLTMADLGFTAF